MKQASIIIAHQWKLFFKDKGMLLFYLGSIILLGIVWPILFKEIISSLTLAVFMTVTLQKQWTAESMAGERENRTLESLLSTPISTRNILLGKACFHMLCAVAYYLMMLSGILVTNYFTGTENMLTPADWAVYVTAVLCVLIFTAFYGVLSSAKAANVREAGIRPSVVCYVFVFLQAMLIAALTMGEGIPPEGAVIIPALFFIAAGCAIAYSLSCILRLGRPGIIEAERDRKITTGRKSVQLSKRVRSQTWSVFAHEMKYLRTCGGLLFQFSILALCPAIMLYLGYYFLGQNNLYYAILTTMLSIPRIPSNLIAYSVGGEKAYKTGESILSTPVTVPALFWGKVTVPMMICSVMLILSSVLNLAVANMIAWLQGGRDFMFYDTAQFILLYGVGLALSLTMIFATCILTLTAKNPRIGLYFSTILGMGFILPVLVIVYVIEFKLAGVLIYLVLLLAACIVMYSKIRRASRKTLMASLR